MNTFSFEERLLIEDWQEFDQFNIYDLKPFPFLNWLNKIFQSLCDPTRHDMRLASVISIAGHLAHQKYKCPAHTNFYILSLMPTGAGKNRFLKTITALMEYFECQNDIFADIETYEGLYQQLKKNNKCGYNLIDEVGETLFELKHSSRGAQVRKALKMAATDTDLHLRIKASRDKDSKKSLQKIFLSLFWTGTEYAFTHVTAEDFYSGMLGRFLFFNMKYEDIPYIGVGSLQDLLRENKEISTQRLLNYLPPKELPNFSKGIKCSKFLEKWLLSFSNIITEKHKKLCVTQNVHNALLARVTHNVLKLAFITQNSKGNISKKGILWATSVVIHSLKNAVYLTHKHFNLTPLEKDMEAVVGKIVSLGENTNTVERRALYKSIWRMGPRRIDWIIQTLENDKKIECYKALNPNTNKNIAYIRLLK